ncbi:hypothetical protein PHLH6_56770 [Pseudomonas sp. Seg1]|uniref:peptidase inhibitor n=1 Tax=unclassified Pseudomonas TaxID=196821 RepID=UPI000CD09566|nr:MULTISPECIES: peptidase inhibitor [unclassified Pseudomonas]POA49617.1 peptidase inhibitor [Pseudomonas sp. MPR-ANC1]BBP73673.1 hypothetical protein PHLH6_56770 [Pseudomonas sp. Seg1]
MPNYCNLNNAKFFLGDIADSDNLLAVRNAAGVKKHRLEVPDGLYNLRTDPDRIRVLVNERNEIIELICG